MVLEKIKEQGTPIELKDRLDKDSPFNLFGFGIELYPKTDIEEELVNSLFLRLYQNKDYNVSYVMGNEDEELVTKVSSYLKDLDTPLRLKTESLEFVIVGSMFTSSVLFAFQDEGEKVVGLIYPTFK